MILADTSVWVDHLRDGDPGLAALLGAARVLGHPWIRGEIALGRLRGRGEVLGLLAGLPQAPVASAAEMLALVEGRRLCGWGIGWVDAQLLAATLLSPGAALWTRDGRLAHAATALGVGWG